MSPLRRTQAAIALRDGAMALTMLPLAIFLVAMAGFAIGVPIGALVVPLAGAGSVAAVAFLCGGRRSAGILASAFLVCALAGVAARWTYDNSWDGIEYHQEAVLRLAAGWNPMRGPLPNLGYETVEELSLEHYPKAPWILGAAVMASTGSVETGKLFNLVLMAAAAAAVAALLLQTTTLRPTLVAGLALVAAANPVAIVQAHTFCVDGLMASLLTILIAAALSRAAAPDRGWWILGGLALVLVANTKFTGPPLALFLLVGLGALHVRDNWRERLVGTWVVPVAACLFSVFIFGYAPYTKNWIDQGHPLFPLVGEGAIDIMTDQRPANLHEFDRVRRFVIASLSVSGNPLPPESTRLKFPFAIRSGEHRAWQAPDARAGGFGPLFSGVLSLVVLVLLRNRHGGPTHASLWLVAAAVVFGSIFITAEGWWARYAPQMWLVPVFVAIPALESDRRVVRALAAALFCAITVNIAVVSVCATYYQWRFSFETRHALASMAVGDRPRQVWLAQFRTLGRRLSEAGISFSLLPDSVAVSISNRRPIPAPLLGAAFYVD